MLPGVKRTSAAALRLGPALVSALRAVLPARGRVLEIGSGTGEHVLLLARAFPDLEWQPSDPDPEARASIEAWARGAALANLRRPLDYDLRASAWRRRRADAILCVNVLHAAPEPCIAELCAGGAEILPAGGPLAVCGPFAHRRMPRGARLARLDAALREFDASLGVREVEALVEAGRPEGLVLQREIPMPEDGDLLLVLRRAG